MSDNVQKLNNLRLLQRKGWSDRNPEERSQDRESLLRLGQNPDLLVLLRFLEFQKAQATSPLDPTQTNWQQIALINLGKVQLIDDIARIMQSA